MSRVIFVNGQYCDYNKSNIHVEDRGYQFADGVYEVFTVINSSIVDYTQHLDRLYRSLSELKIKSPISKNTYIFVYNSNCHKSTWDGLGRVWLG